PHSREIRVIRRITESVKSLFFLLISCIIIGPFRGYSSFFLKEKGSKRTFDANLPKKADAFSAKEDSLRSAPRGLWPLRHSLRTECFSDVHAAGKTISLYFAPCAAQNSARRFVFPRETEFRARVFF